MIEIQNAKIRSTTLGREDHGIFTCMIDLDYGGAGQGFGGYALDQWRGERGAGGRRIGTAYGLEFIAAILRTLEVESWEKLPGTVCRVRAEHTKVHSIGHFLKDQWFDPAELLVEMKPVAWAIFADNGNIRLWSTRPQTANEVGAVPLYTDPRPASPSLSTLRSQIEGLTVHQDWGPTGDPRVRVNTFEYLSRNEVLALFDAIT